MIRTRFAPSPTGFVHIGSLRTALFAFLFARANQGKLVLRIEDTDQNRKVEGAVENLLKVMKLVGIEFDEGYHLSTDGKIVEQGEYGPYFQSQRLSIYRDIAQKLIETRKAYYCFCSQARLDDLKKEQVAFKKPPMYDRLCKKLTPNEISAKLSEFKANGKSPVIRFAIPETGQTIIHDLIYGDIVYENKILDDQVILKSDGFPTYHLAVVVDDHFMEITHVIRGEEWLPSTPKHLLIYQALGWNPTAYAHLPLILNPDKSKLSKRQGDVAVEDFLKHGYLKEALINFVAFLGWNPKTDQEIFSLNELINQFDLAKVNKAGAVFDDNKLDWFNSQYIKKLSPENLVERLKPYWEQTGLLAILKDKHPSGNFEPFLLAMAQLEQERLKKLSEIGEATDFFFTLPEYNPELLIWKKSTVQDAKQKLQALMTIFQSLNETTWVSTPNLQTVLENFITQNQFDKGSVLWPLRTALTGKAKSPPPFDVARVLYLGFGPDEILTRLQTAITKLN